MYKRPRWVWVCGAFYAAILLGMLAALTATGFVVGLHSHHMVAERVAYVMLLTVIFAGIGVIIIIRLSAPPVLRSLNVLDAIAAAQAVDAGSLIPNETEFTGLCRCGAQQLSLLDADSVAFIVRCKTCHRQTGPELGPYDALNAWEMLGT